MEDPVQKIKNELRNCYSVQSNLKSLVLDFTDEQKNAVKNCALSLQEELTHFSEISELTPFVLTSLSNEIRIFQLEDQLRRTTSIMQGGA